MAKSAWLYMAYTVIRWTCILQEWDDNPIYPSVCLHVIAAVVVVQLQVYLFVLFNSRCQQHDHSQTTKFVKVMQCNLKSLLFPLRLLLIM